MFYFRLLQLTYGGMNRQKQILFKKKNSQPGNRSWESFVLHSWNSLFTQT